MSLPPWVAPVAVGLAVAVALAALLWAAYQALMWFATLVILALTGLFVIGYGLDPTVIAAAGFAPLTGT